MTEKPVEQTIREEREKAQREAVDRLLGDRPRKPLNLEEHSAPHLSEDNSPVVPTTLTAAQMRVLRFCAAHPKWVSLLELDALRLLEADDVLTVPSLVKRGLLHHQPALQEVRIAPAGEVYARG